MSDQNDVRAETLTDARFRLAAIAESSDDAIVGKDLNGIVTSWNKAAEAMFGHAADEIVGQPITRIIPPQRIDEEACRPAAHGRSGHPGSAVFRAAISSHHRARGPAWYREGARKAAGRGRAAELRQRAQLKSGSNLWPDSTVRSVSIYGKALKAIPLRRLS